MNWVWTIAAVWLMLGGFMGILIGRGIRLADRKQAETAAAGASAPNFVVDPAVRPVQAQVVPRQASAPPIECTPSARRPDRS